MSSRWFRVVADRFDWSPRRGVVFSFPRGAVGFRPAQCIAAGVAKGAIVKIDRPAGARVRKDGSVVINGR